MKINNRRKFLIGAMTTSISPHFNAQSQTRPSDIIETELDKKVLNFLRSKKDAWGKGVNLWNIRYEDGQALHDLVVRRGFKRLLEVGTSTGHAALWLGWAAARTGGNLTTLEVDPGRYREAVNNVRQAGLSHAVDVRLGDAHELVRSLQGPWDFVFQDADKDWYLQYWRDLKDKMSISGCYVADNVLRPMAKEVGDFVLAARSDSAFETKIDDLGSGEGILTACRIR